MPFSLDSAFTKMQNEGEGEAERDGMWACKDVSDWMPLAMTHHALSYNLISSTSMYGSCTSTSQGEGKREQGGKACVCMCAGSDSDLPARQYRHAAGPVEPTAGPQRRSTDPSCGHRRSGSAGSAPGRWQACVCRPWPQQSSPTERHTQHISDLTPANLLVSCPRGACPSDLSHSAEQAARQESGLKIPADGLSRLLTLIL